MKSKACIAALLLMTAACSAERHDPAAHLQIDGVGNWKSAIFDASIRYGEKRGFAVLHGNLMKEGRNVRQLEMQSPDGLLMTLDDFRSENRLDAVIIPERPHADWQSVKSTWMREMAKACANQCSVADIKIQ